MPLPVKLSRQIGIKSDGSERDLAPGGTPVLGRTTAGDWPTLLDTATHQRLGHGRPVRRKSFFIKILVYFSVSPTPIPSPLGRRLHRAIG